MRRFFSLLAAGALLVALPMTATGAVPDYQRVITSRLADAALVATDGCIVSEIFVSASDAVYGGRPGPVNKQGLAGVLVRRTDICASASTGSPAVLGIHAAGGGDGGTVVFDGLGQTLESLESTSRFDTAWLDATIPVTNELTGETVAVQVELTWSLVGELARDTGHSHIPPRLFGGTANSHWNTLSGDAAVSGAVTIDRDRLAFDAVDGAHIQQVKYGCQVILHPLGDADLDC